MLHLEAQTVMNSKKDMNSLEGQGWLFQLLVPMVISSILNRVEGFFAIGRGGTASRFLHARALRGPANPKALSRILI